MKKLVRDLIPDIINKSGNKANFYQANDNDFKDLLKNKLIEEVQEFIESESIEEIADIYEVIDAICLEYNFDKEHINQIKNQKNIERGSFTKKIVLIKE